MLPHTESGECCFLIRDLFTCVCELFLQECLRLRLLQPCCFATWIFRGLVFEHGLEHRVVVPVGQKVRGDVC